MKSTCENTILLQQYLFHLYQIIVSINAYRIELSLNHLYLIPIFQHAQLL